MTIETKILKPISLELVQYLDNLVNEYEQLDLIQRSISDGLKAKLNCGYGEVNLFKLIDEDELNNLILLRLSHIESEINVLGYTMQDEPKEWQYHMNILKGEDDE